MNQILCCARPDRNNHKKDLPCIILQGDGRERESQALCYQDAYQAQQEHARYLQLRIHSFFAPEKESCTRNTGLDIVFVAYFSNNIPDFFLSVLACTGISIPPAFALPVLLNTRWTAAEMARALQTMISAASTTKGILLLYQPKFRPVATKVHSFIRSSSGSTIAMALDEIPHFTREMYCTTTCWPECAESSVQVQSQKKNTSVVEDQIEQLIHEQKARVRESCKDALIVFTSGTTSSTFKGVRLSEGAILIQALAKQLPPCQYNSSTSLLANNLPFYHVGGLSSILAVWLAGGRLIFPSPAVSATSFDPGQVIRSISCDMHPTNTLVMVPAMLHSLQEYCEENENQVASHVYPRVQLILVGGQSASASLHKFVNSKFPNAELVQTYACTEAASSLTFRSIPRVDSYPALSRSLGDCVGKPPRHVQLKIVSSGLDISGSSKNGIGSEIGLIATKGPHVMNGYWDGSPKHVSSGLDPNGWYISSDIGWIDDDGNLYFIGRASDTIRTGGETVMAVEVERAVETHPNVKDCAVFALPDTRLGETVSCVIVERDCRGRPPHDCALSLAGVQKWCRESGLAGYKLPRKLFFMNNLPRNSSGKIQKFLLAERFTTKPIVQSKL